MAFTGYGIQPLPLIYNFEAWMPTKTKSNNLVVGLDIGTTKICAIAVNGDSRENLDIVGVGTTKSDGLRKGVVVNIDRTVRSIKKALD